MKKINLKKENYKYKKEDTMKLLINYDFFNAIRNVNEKTNPLKVIRNEKKRYAIYFPIYLSTVLLIHRHQQMNISDIMSPIIKAYGILIPLDFMFEMTVKKLSPFEMDLYAEKASIKLKELTALLNTINVSTTYDKLLTSELYYKTCNIEYNNHKIPDIVSKKYIYVPSYGFDGNEKTTSILQEHIIGTKDYILSQDEPDKEYHHVLAKSHI